VSARNSEDQGEDEGAEIGNDAHDTARAITGGFPGQIDRDVPAGFQHVSTAKQGRGDEREDHGVGLPGGGAVQDIAHEDHVADDEDRSANQRGRDDPEEQRDRVHDPDESPHVSS